MKKDWKKLGLIEGIPEENQESLIKLLDQLNFDLIDNNDGKDICIAVLRYTFSLIVIKDKKLGVLDYYGKRIDAKKILDDFDVKEFTLEFNEYNNEFVPKAQDFLSNLDGGAEAYKLFGEHYAMGLAEKHVLIAQND